MSKIDTSSWKKFKISDLFTAQTGNVDIQKTHINGKGISVVSSGVEGNGIIGKTDMDAKVFPAGTLTVDMFGNVFYRDFKYKMVTHARVFSMSLKNDVANMPVEIGLFLEASLKFLTQMFSFNNMCTFDKISDLEISLPVTTQDVPDWDYMQERIAELEQERIAELEQYLVAAGLNDYTLTEDDLKVLSLSGSGRDEDGNPAAHAAVSKPMKEFQMDNIVDVLTPKQRFNANTVSIDKYRKKGYAYVVRTSENNGIRGNIEADESYLNDARTFSFGQDTATIFWQIEPYFTGDKIKVLKPKYCLTDEMAQYIMASIRQAFSHFVWGQQSFSEKVICKMMIILPIQTDESGTPVIDEAKVYHPDGYVPDWEYMAAYIRAMEKLVIRDVVDYKDEFIRQHRLAVAGSGV